MSLRSAVAMSMVGSALLISSGGLLGQEVNSDVKIPPPREIVTSAPAATGFGGGQATAGAATLQALQAAIQTTVAQVQTGSIGENQVRAQLGNFTVSLLVKAGVLSFGGGAAAGRPTEEEAPSGRPAWTGRLTVGGSADRARRVAGRRSARRL